MLYTWKLQKGDAVPWKETEKEVLQAITRFHFFLSWLEAQEYEKKLNFFLIPVLLTPYTQGSDIIWSFIYLMNYFAFAGMALGPNIIHNLLLCENRF